MGLVDGTAFQAEFWHEPLTTSTGGNMKTQQEELYEFAKDIEGSDVQPMMQERNELLDINEELLLHGDIEAVFKKFDEDFANIGRQLEALQDKFAHYGHSVSYYNIIDRLASHELQHIKD